MRTRSLFGGEPIRSTNFLLSALLVAIGCNDSAVTEPEVHQPVDHVEVVVGGQVLDGDRNPVAGAYAYVWVGCASEPDPGCLTSTGRLTDAQGRFLITLELPLQVETPVRARAEATPPLGQGYVLGKGMIAEFEAVFQPPPVADTTFVEIVLPPNSVDSRRPVRIQAVGHRASRLRADTDRVYVSSPGGVAAMDQATGEWLWQKGRTAGLAGPPYVVVEGVVVMARGATLTALRAVDGEILWSRDGALTGFLTAGEGGGFFASDGRNVAGYDLESGATRWTRELIGSGNVAIAAGESLVCAEILAYVECWEPSSGDPLWSRPTEFANWLAIVGDRVILGAQSGWTAFDGKTGAMLWQTAVTTFNSPALVEGGDSVFACSSAECVALRVSDGQFAWRTAIPHPASPATDGEFVYVVGWLDDSSSLYVLDAGTGAIRERILPDPFYGGFGGAPVVGKDLVFVYGGFGHLYAFDTP